MVVVWTQACILRGQESTVGTLAHTEAPRCVAWRYTELVPDFAMAILPAGSKCKYGTLTTLLPRRRRKLADFAGGHGLWMNLKSTGSARS
jgi:hypothetical protein